jgi:hypothetical protein
VLQVIENTGDFAWGGRESFGWFREISTKTGVFSTARLASANWCFQIFSSARFHLLPFSDFAGAMTLEMSLAADVLRGLLVGNRLAPRTLFDLRH